MNLSALLPPGPDDTGGPVFPFATVTDNDPLTVQVDGDDTPVPAPPVSLVAGLEVGDRVLTLMVNRALIVVGRVGGTAVPEPYEPPDPVMRAQAGQASFQLYTTGGKTVTFPTAFAAAPRVILTLAVTPSSTADVISLNVDSVTASSFYIYANCPGNFAGATAYVNWLAIPDGALSL